MDLSHPTLTQELFRVGVLSAQMVGNRIYRQSHHDEKD